jgi:hypothetical protein
MHLKLKPTDLKNKLRNYDSKYLVEKPSSYFFVKLVSYYKLFLLLSVYT